MMKKKKNARERRVLVGAVVVAGVMVAGSTFAWFTSKDEVTNRLTASADYGVSVVEDFAPPKDLTPGQEVEKDVAVVNTGNIDAFVKVALKNELTLTTLEGKGITTTAPGTGLTGWTINLPTGTNTYVELATADGADTNTGELTTNEVSTLQAGGILVFKGDEAVAVKDQFVCAGDMGTDDSDTDFNGARQFKPTKTGLYLFKRNNGDGTSTTPEYSGYYYVAASGTDTEKYYALETKTGKDLDATNGKATAITPYVKGTITLGTTEGTDKDVVTGISDIKILTKTTNENVATTYTLGKLATNATTGAHEFTAKAADAAADKSTVTHIKVTNGATNPVTFYIKLDDDWSDKWTYLAPTGDAATDGVVDNFLYNDTLKAGTTSKKLVDSVVMDNTVTQAAFNELTYDLSVLMDSIQVTKNSEGDDLLTETGWGVTATANNSPAISVNGVAEKIVGLTWANASN